MSVFMLLSPSPPLPSLHFFPFSHPYEHIAGKHIACGQDDGCGCQGDGLRAGQACGAAELHEDHVRHARLPGPRGAQDRNAQGLLPGYCSSFTNSVARDLLI
jgi:hypothetical protein